MKSNLEQIIETIKIHLPSETEEECKILSNAFLSFWDIDIREIPNPIETIDKLLDLLNDKNNMDYMQSVNTSIVHFLRLPIHKEYFERILVFIVSNYRSSFNCLNDLLVRSFWFDDDFIGIFTDIVNSSDDNSTKEIVNYLFIAYLEEARKIDHSDLIELFEVVLNNLQSDNS